MGIQSKYKHWMNNLLDLGNRNPLLNLKKESNRAIQITYPLAKELWNTIVINEKALKFPSGKDSLYAENKNITTNFSIKETQDILLKLKKKAQIICEEQDVNTLFLTFGLLQWVEPQKNIMLTSPLLLVPVMLYQESINSPISMKMNEDEIVINPTLAYRLKLDWNVDLPQYNDDYVQCIQDLHSFADKQGWHVQEESFLSLFSFMKINMYKDLERNKDRLFQNPIIRGLAGDTSLMVELANQETNGDFGSLLDELQPEDVYHVLDADSSQQDAIFAASRGESFVLQGPPGTGKSQTIVNIIATKLALREKVLFVSEKKTALDVVFKRLKEVGLGEFCLALHDVKANKRETLAQLEQSMALSNKKIKLSEELGLELKKLKNYRDSLNSYAKQINTKIEPLKKNIYNANGYIAKYEMIPNLTFPIPMIGNISKQHYERILSSVLDYARTIKNANSIDNNPWKNTNITHLSNSLINELDEKKAEILPNLFELTRIIETFKLDTKISFNACYSEMGSNLRYFNLAQRVLCFNDNKKDSVGSISELKKLQERQKQLSDDYAALLNNASLNVLPLLNISNFADSDVLVEKCLEIQNELKNNPSYKNLEKDESRADYVLKHIEITEKYCQLRQDILKHYDATILSSMIFPKLKALELRFKNKYQSTTKYLSPSYYEDIKFIKKFALDQTKKLADTDILELLQKLMKCNEYKRVIEDQQSNMSYYFPNIYRMFETDFSFMKALVMDYKVLKNGLKILDQIVKGINVLNNKKIDVDSLIFEAYSNLDSDLTVLDNAAKGITGFKGTSQYSYIKRLCSDKEFLDYIAKAEDKILDLFNKVEKGLNWFFGLFDKSEGLEHVELKELYSRMCKCLDNPGELQSWIDYNVHKHKLVDMGFGEFVSNVEHYSLSPDEIVPAFEKRFYSIWIDDVSSRNVEVQNFRISKQEDRIRNFAQLDREQFGINRVRIKEQLINALPNLESFTTGEVNILKKEIGKQRSNMPIRKLFSRIPNLLPMLKPCMMMSPLTVSHYLESDMYSFDTVIFDEASQVKTENALGAIMRSKQVIIVGDSKQLPPTNFFEVQSQEIDFDEELEDELGESVLDDALFLPNQNLLWHYRSRHEDLIAFSNANIYGNHLVTFPSTIQKKENFGVEYIYVDDGIYNGKSAPKGNPREADVVAGLVFQHIEDCPTRTLGVIAFGVVQQEAIESAINKLRKEHPEYEYFFQDDRHEAFFVKSLENVQGDERDSIIFSIGYAKSSDGKMAMRFGPLSMMGGERRLNVAITRAKYNIKLVGSILPTDIDANRISQNGPKLLRKYIEYAMNGKNATNDAFEDHIPAENYPFETMLYKFLEECGYLVERRIGCSNYRIDLAIKHPDYPDVYVLGIECDGESYSLHRTARERDRLRTEILKAMGWNLYKVWALAWVRDTVSEKQRLIKAIDTAIRDYQKQGLSEKKDTESMDDTVIADISDFSSEEKKSCDDTLMNAFEHYEKFDTNERCSETSIFNLLPLFEEIVALEQPIHSDIAAERIAKIIGKERSSVVAKRLVTKLALILRGRITFKDGFLCCVSMSDVKLREAGERTIFQISADEIAKAMNLYKDNSVGLSREELIRLTCKGFGFKRLTEKIATRLEYVLDEKMIL